jgi:hypothetical protein
MTKARETYTVKYLNEGTISKPFHRNHAETNETRLSDVGISVSAERRAISKDRLT